MHCCFNVQGFRQFGVLNSCAILRFGGYLYKLLELIKLTGCKSKLAAVDTAASLQVFVYFKSLTFVGFLIF